MHNRAMYHAERTICRFVTRDVYVREIKRRTNKRQRVQRSIRATAISFIRYRGRVVSRKGRRRALAGDRACPGRQGPPPRGERASSRTMRADASCKGRGDGSVRRGGAEERSPCRERATRAALGRHGHCSRRRARPAEPIKKSGRPRAIEQPSGHRPPFRHAQGGRRLLCCVQRGTYVTLGERESARATHPVPRPPLHHSTHGVARVAPGARPVRRRSVAVARHRLIN